MVCEINVALVADVNGKFANPCEKEVHFSILKKINHHR